MFDIDDVPNFHVLLYKWWRTSRMYSLDYQRLFRSLVRSFVCRRLGFSSLSFSQDCFHILSCCLISYMSHVKVHACADTAGHLHFGFLFSLHLSLSTASILVRTSSLVWLWRTDASLLCVESDHTQNEVLFCLFIFQWVQPRTYAHNRSVRCICGTERSGWHEARQVLPAWGRPSYIVDRLRELESKQIFQPVVPWKLSSSALAAARAGRAQAVDHHHGSLQVCLHAFCISSYLFWADA